MAAHSPTTGSRAPSQAESSKEDLQESYWRGYADGEAVGRAAQADALTEQFRESIAKLSTARAALFRSAQKDVLQLSVAIAQKILHREIQTSPDVLGGIISVALERIEAQDVHCLRIHPSMVRRIEDQLAKWAGRKITIVADAGLELGGCLFETHHGNVDAGIESQLAEIERGLADHLEAHR